jgi:hypothetical protein
MAERTPSFRRVRRSLLYYLPLVSLVLAILACGSFVPYSKRASIAITHRPASDLRLSLGIRDQYSDKPAIVVLVEVHEGTSGQVFGLAKPAKMTCNGQDITPTIQGFVHPCPRQPPGGAYQITYTDEHGATSTVTVPVPKGIFAILSPQPGAHVPIPTNGVLPVRFSTPLPSSQTSLDINTGIAWCGAPQWTCGEVVATLPSAAVATPSVANGTVTTATPDLVSCPPSPPLENGIVSLRGDQVTLNMTGNFGSFQPGPGGISVGMSECTMPDPAGFASVRATFVDNLLNVPITWV